MPKESNFKAALQCTIIDFEGSLNPNSLNLTINREKFWLSIPSFFRKRSQCSVLKIKVYSLISDKIRSKLVWIKLSW